MSESEASSQATTVSTDPQGDDRIRVEILSWVLARLMDVPADELATQGGRDRFARMCIMHWYLEDFFAHRR